MSDQSSSVLPGNWVSAHIFLRSWGQALQDKAVLQILKPVVADIFSRQLAHSYFFIRYGELGPHLRLRILAKPTKTNEVKRLILDQVQKVDETALLGPPQEDSYDRSTRSEHRSLLWIPYLPEVARYGGPHGVEVAERLFYASSKVCMQLIEGIESGAFDRDAMSLATSVVLLGSMALDREQARDICCSCSRWHVGGDSASESALHDLQARFRAAVGRQPASLSHQVAAYWSACGDKTLPAPLGSYAVAAAQTQQALATLIQSGKLVLREIVPITDLRSAIGFLAPSFLHMSCVRLGIPNVTESFLAFLIADSLSQMQCGL